jgi:hypothetical protein
MDTLQINQRYDGAVRLDELTPHPKNPRVGDVGAIHESILSNKFFGAVLAQEGSGLIIAGEHRWRAAMTAGKATVPVIYLDVDAEQATRILLSDNRTQDLAAYNNPVLRDILEALDKNTEQQLEGTGFDSEDLDALIRSLDEPMELDGTPDEKPKKTTRPKFELVFETEEKLQDFTALLAALADLFPQHDGHEARLMALLEESLAGAS